MEVKSEWAQETRARNILTLEERVQAIRAFDRQPVYQKVADIMNCSAKQIRNIVMNRESILLYYASKTGDCQGSFSKHKDRTVKIDLLNQVMYEWIQRTQSRQDIGRISTKLIRTIALDIKNHIKVPSFYPNTVWLENFMSTYNITDEDLLNQKVYNRSIMPKEHLSLKISDIVEDVKHRGETNYKGLYTHLAQVEPRNNISFEPKVEDSSSLLFENSNSGTGDDYDEVRVVIENDDDEEDDEYMVAPSKIRKIEKTKPANHTTDEVVCIESYEDALRHLKPLEDFVLLEENFRAIGVISQLEAIFRNPERSKTG